MEKIIQILCFTSLFIYLIIRLRYELQMMQQNSYRNKRYLKWLKSNLISTHRVLIFLVFIVACFFIHIIYLEILVSIFAATGIVYELTRKYKKALVYTNRAIRLLLTSSLLAFLLISLLFFITQNVNITLLTVLFLNVLSFIILMTGNIINVPIESAINKSYYNEAKRILAQHKHLVIIGITGSYGKTSTKHYLHRILSEKYNVLMTPGSYNTVMGVIRTIRENLKPYHEIFIVEMGAKQQGDIKEICDLVQPNIGILTSIGEQHLETFKSIENIQKTKFELIDSLPKNGFAVLNADFEYVASRNVENVNNLFYYSSFNKSKDYYIDDITYSFSGTDFVIKRKNGLSESFSTKIVGKHNLSNILAGIMVAEYLNVEINAIKYAVSHIEQVEHRLTISQTPAGITIIDDAFNSNPSGAEMALEVLKGFQSGKRIMVTPGMIELGEKQFEYNYKLGQQISTSADYVIIVGEYNREAISQGLLENNFNKENLYTAPSFTNAVKHLNDKLQKGDVVLYENDLPDTFK